MEGKVKILGFHGSVSQPRSRPPSSPFSPSPPLLLLSGSFALFPFFPFFLPSGSPLPGPPSSFLPFLPFLPFLSFLPGPRALPVLRVLRFLLVLPVLHSSFLPGPSLLSESLLRVLPIPSLSFRVLQVFFSRKAR